MSLVNYKCFEDGFEKLIALKNIDFMLSSELFMGCEFNPNIDYWFTNVLIYIF